MRTRRWARAINREFLSAKVDREERPDVDAVYMAACVAMNGSGGWPLTVLLTPDEIGHALGERDGGRFCRWYGVAPSENFEGKSALNLLEQPEFDREPEGMAALREKVCAYRLARTALHRDDKVLTAWNGLARLTLGRGDGGRQRTFNCAG